MSEDKPIDADEKLMKYTIITKLDDVDEVEKILQAIRDKKLCENMYSYPIRKKDNTHVKCFCGATGYTFRPSAKCLKNCKGYGTEEINGRDQVSCYQLKDENEKAK